MSVLSNLITWWMVAVCQLFTNFLLKVDTLTPYENTHGSGLTHQVIKDCHQKGNEPYEIYKAHVSENKNMQFVKVKRFYKVINLGSHEAVVHGHYAIISDPLRTISVLEPMKEHGCNLNLRQTVMETAKRRKCEVAINAGYFNTKNGKCLGNVITDGYLAHNSGGIQNAHFGLTKDNNIFIGYVPETDVKENSKFLQLVGGVMWLVRNSSDYINTSKNFECESTEETGTVDKFINTLSSRTAIGHDSKGNVVIVQVDGKTNHYGISLYGMQYILNELGLVNAINLDGGGSSTFVVNDTVVNYPSDECSQSKLFICERKVSTVICVHPPDCQPPDCNGHGKCENGVCVCDKYWQFPNCDKLICNNNCSNHSICTINDCQCQLEYFGKDCETIHHCIKGKGNSESSVSKCIWMYPYVIIIAMIICIVFMLVFLIVMYQCSCYFKSQQRFFKKPRRHRYMDLQTMTGLSDSSDSDIASVNAFNKK